jgi:lipopolysaccharide exporter
MLNSSLTSSTVSGLGWSGGTVLVTAGLQLVYTAQISRLLEPADFGVMAAALVGLRFVTYFSRFGIGSAVIQARDFDPVQESTALRISISFGILAGATTVLLSPILARIVAMPESAGVMRWLALGVSLGAIGVVPEAVLRRRMRFRLLGITNVMSYTIGFLVVGIAGARAGWGVWSLVAATITQSGSMLILNMIAARIDIRHRLSTVSAISMLRFGGTVTVTGFLEFLSISLDTLAVGRFLGAGTLGQYSRATFLVALPVEQATTATSRVLMPSLSRVQDDPVRFSQAVATLTGLYGALVLVPAAMIAASAPALVPWLLGPGWEQAAQLVPYVSVACALSLLTNSTAVAAEARGQVGRKLAIQTVALATTATLLGIVIAVGPTAERIAGAWALGELFRHGFYWIAMFPRLGLIRSAVIRQYASAATLATAGAVPVIVVVHSSQNVGFVMLAGSALAGLGGAAALLATPAGSPIRNDINSVRSRLRF